MFTVAPSVALIAWTLLVLMSLSALMITALKGRWLWFIVGLFTMGLVCLYSAFLPAEPGSLWSRWEARRGKRQPGESARSAR